MTTLSLDAPGLPPPSPRWKRWAKWGGLAAGVAVLWVLFDIVRFARECHHYTNRARLGSQQVPVPRSKSEAIVVLTGDAGRIPRALELLRDRGSPLLIISGTGKGTTLRDLYNQQGDAYNYIHETWGKIILESDSGSTIENAENSARLLMARSIDRVILVTSDYHMGRSLAVFRRVLPMIEILDFSVSSPLKAPALWKIGAEYWKSFAFRHYFASHLEPFARLASPDR